MILIFDPGPSTGVALLNWEGMILHTEVLVTIEEVKEHVAKQRKNLPRNVTIVAEEGPVTGQYRKYTQQVEEVIRTAFPDTVWVKPGEWKGHPAATVTVEEARNRTQHEKDAVSLGRYAKRVKL